MGAGTLFQKIYKMDYPKKSYADKAVRYQDAKKLNLKALKNAERSLENGEATVMPGPFVKDPQIEKHIRSVNKYNKALDDLGKEFEDKVNGRVEAIKAKEALEANPEYQEARQALVDLVSEKTDLINEKSALIDKKLNTPIGTPERQAIEEEIAKMNDHIKALEEEVKPVMEKVGSFEGPFGEKYGPMNDEWLPYTERQDRKALDAVAKRIAEGDDSGYMPYEYQWYINSRLPNAKNIAPVRLSNVNDITRYHTTKMKNLPYIFTSGLETGRGGQGYGGVLLDRAGGDEIGQVYTTSRAPFYNKVSGDDFEDERWRADYSPYDPSEITLRLDIPKKDYRKLQRSDWNPEQGIAFGFDGNHGSLLQTIQEGGRTDIFEDNLPAKYITKGIDDNGVEEDLEDLIKNYECGGGYDDDCADWQDALLGSGLLNFDPETGEEEWNQKLFDKIRAARNNAHKR